MDCLIRGVITFPDIDFKVKDNNNSWYQKREVIDSSQNAFIPNAIQ